MNLFCIVSISFWFIFTNNIAASSPNADENELKLLYQNYFDWKLKTWPEESAGKRIISHIQV